MAKSNAKFNDVVEKIQNVEPFEDEYGIIHDNKIPDGMMLQHRIYRKGGQYHYFQFGQHIVTNACPISRGQQKFYYVCEHCGHPEVYTTKPQEADLFCKACYQGGIRKSNGVVIGFFKKRQIPHELTAVALANEVHKYLADSQGYPNHDKLQEFFRLTEATIHYKAIREEIQDRLDEKPLHGAIVSVTSSDAGTVRQYEDGYCEYVLDD